METKTNPYISFVLPAYNEELAVGHSIRQVREVMQKLPLLRYEIIVVDDNSTDKTGEIATKENVTVIRRTVNGGSGASRKTGIRVAQGELIAMFDVDGSYDISRLPEMISFFPEYDQVNGARTKEMGTMKILRTPAKWFLRKFASYLAKTKIPDLNTGFKIFKRDIMLRYMWVIPDGFSCVTTMTLAFLCNGYRVKYVSTEYYNRIGKSKFHPIKDTLKYFSTIIRLVLFFAPMRVFGQLSFIFFIVGSFLSTQHKILLNYVKTSDVIILILAVQLFALGLLAELIVATKRS